MKLDIEETFTLALENAVTQHGNNLMELSRERPVLLVFLRHFG